MTMLVCYNYADNFLHLCINPSKILFDYGGTFDVFRGTIWFQNFKKKSVIFGATDYSIFFFEDNARQTLVSTVAHP